LNYADTLIGHQVRRGDSGDRLEGQQKDA
jgi:hypothetical protein